MTSPSERQPTADVVTRLKDAAERGGGYTELAEDCIREVESLREALRPFAEAHFKTQEFLSRCGDNHSCMESRDLYMWHAPRTLSMSHFKGAVIALGHKP